MKILSHRISSQEQYQICYESIAKAFPEIKKDYPWFPDRPKLYLSALGGENSQLFSFCCWIEQRIPPFLRIMKLFLQFNKLGDEENLKIFHDNFTMIVVNVWIIDCIIGKLEEGNLYPSIRIGFRNKMHKLLNDAIKVVVQGDTLWLGEHADWWVPKTYKKRRLTPHVRKRK